MDRFSPYQEEIARICRELGAVRLDVFGSSARGEEGPDSYIDVVARLDRSRGDMFRRYFELKEQLQEIFRRPVDLVLDDAIRNPYFRQAVDQSRVSLY